MSERSKAIPEQEDIQKDGNQKGDKIATKKRKMNGERSYVRFSQSQIFEHWIQAISFIILALTGLPQRYSDNAVSKGLISALGGIEGVRIIHRSAAIVLMVLTVYHIGAVFYRTYVLGHRGTMLPSMTDVRNAIHSLLYNIGVRKTRPQQGRYTFEEKAEYWALVWGTVIMIITGFMMWNPIATTNFLPGQWIPAAKAAHGNEALLAVLAIILWHLYSVLIKHFNRSMFTGRISEEEMLQEHPLELADIKAGVVQREPPAPLVEKRRRVFFPIYALIAAVLLVAIYIFVTYEETAIATVPPAEDVEIFAPFTPTPLPTALPTNTPQPTTAPQAGATPGAAAEASSPAWEGEIAELFQSKCSACHGGASPMGGLNLTSYEGVMKGGATGPAVVPGEAETSLIYIRQSAGNHPGQFSDQELEQVVEWIEAGVPETAPQASEAPTTEVTAGAMDWEPEIASMLDQACATCHNSTAKTGGLDISTYQSTLAGGNSGPGVVPGDPEASLIVQIQQAGGHPGQLTAEQLQMLIGWIEAGAPENVESPAGATEIATGTPHAEATAEPKSVTWDSTIRFMLGNKCSACHNPTNPNGGLDITTYQTARLGGRSGPGFVPNDPEASKIVEVQQAGNHPGQLTTEEIQTLIDWIMAGALEE